jgi:uncharacterized delta-60 repeat protein
MKKIFIFLGLFTALLFSAQTVKLDETFGNSNGFEVLEGETIGWSIIRSLILPDGKILVSGNRINGSVLCENFIAKFNPDGQIDASFGNNGFLIIDHPDDNGCSLMYADNHIFAFFDIQDDCIMKFDLNGNLDTAFGNNGVVMVGGYIADYSSGVQYENYLYVLCGDYGDYNSSSFFRYDIKTGALDLSFGTNGKVSLSNKGKAYDIFKSSDDKIFISTRKSNDLTWYLHKFNIDGSLDASFGNNGTIAFYNGSDSDDFPSIVLDSDNNILIAIMKDNEFLTVLKKYDSNGQLITSFGTNGTVSLENILILSIKNFSNKIYLAGANGNYDLALLRLNADGSLDTTFNKTGIYIETSHAGNEWAESFNINTDGSIITAGEYPVDSGGNPMDSENNKIFLAKYLVNEDLATEEISSSNKVSIYPNPAKDVLYFSTNEKIDKAEIYDLNGRLVKFGKISSGYINVSDLSKGLYFIVLQTETGKIKTKFLKN